MEGLAAKNIFYQRSPIKLWMIAAVGACITNIILVYFLILGTIFLASNPPVDESSEQIITSGVIFVTIILMKIIFQVSHSNKLLRWALYETEFEVLASFVV